MKKGTYIASTQVEGSVMFRINADAYTIRKGKDIEVLIKDERAKVTYPASFMSLTLKGDNPKSESTPKAKVEKEIKEVPEVKETKVEKVEPKVEAKKPTPKVETKPEPKVEAKKPATRGRKKSVKIETEEK